MDNLDIKLAEYDLIIINSSAGKDSLCAIWEVCRIAQEQNYPKSKIVVSHQDLGAVEWPQTKALASVQAALFGLKIYYSERRNKQGEYETILDYAKYRKKWPSNTQRWCTSKFKMGPGARVVTMLTKEMKKSKILYVFGFRKQESPNRAKKDFLSLNIRLTTKSRQVWDWLPIQDWTTKQVWEVIKANNLPYHYAYDLGMPRLSCMFCIFSPFDALVIAGKHNYEMLEEYIKVEHEIQHTFRNGFSIASIKEAIENGYEPKHVTDWVM